MRKFAAWYALVVIGLSSLLVIVCGCASRSTAGGTSRIETVQQEASYFDPSAVAGRTNSELVHDFGLLRPGQKAKHRFQVSNTSEIAWTFKRFHINCACTVTHASVPSIAPHQGAKVEIEYKAPSSNADDRRYVQVEFAEPEAPLITLVVQARVREALTVTPAELNFNRVGRGEKCERWFEVHNFSDQDWPSVKVKSSVPWVGAESVFAGTGDGPTNPRQIWRVIVRADTTELPSGKHQGNIEIKSAEGNPSEARLVPVGLLVASPVDAIPGSMFFGTVRAGQSATRKVLLSFASANAKIHAESVVLDHDLGSELDLQLVAKSERFAELSGTFRADGDKEFFEGRITVSFRETALPRMEIPVYARVEQRP